MQEPFNILIAEDNDISLNLMKTVLETNGYNVIAAYDGDAAIKCVQNQHIDLAFVDLNMQPTGGFEFVKYMVANNIKIPVVIVTADESSDILIRAKRIWRHAPSPQTCRSQKAARHCKGD